MQFLTNYNLSLMGFLFIALALLVNRSHSRKTRESRKLIKANLSFEIDHNLNLLHDFLKEIGISPTEPVTLSDALEKARLVVAEDPSPEKVHAIREDFYLTEPPIWNCKVFDNLTSLSFLSEKEQQDVRQFYDKLKLITSIYEKLRTSKEESIVEKLENKIESLVTEMLDWGNPLKNT